MTVLVVRSKNTYSVYASNDNTTIDAIVGCSCGKHCEYHTHMHNYSACYRTVSEQSDDCLSFFLDGSSYDLGDRNGKVVKVVAGFVTIYNTISKILEKEKEKTIEEISISILEALANFLEERRALDSL